MADEADNAAQINDDFMARALAAHAARQRQPRAPTGYCQSAACGDEFPASDNRLFCDGKCAAEAARRG